MKRLTTFLIGLWALTAMAQTQITPDGMYEYTINDDQLSVTIVNYCGPGGEISIPKEIDGLLVTVLGEASFFNKGLTGTLAIPSGVRRIELDAFNANHSLTRVDIPASVNYIHPDAFTYCNGVNDVYLYHVYPDITDPPLFHELDWADPNASSFAGSGTTILHVMNGTVDAHQEGAAPSNNVAIRKWLQQNPASVVDDIELPESFTFTIGDDGYGVAYSTTGWTVPAGVTAQAIVWDDITVKPRDGAEDEEHDTSSHLMHYGWDADNPWLINAFSPTHRYNAGETVPMGCGVLVKGQPGSYTAALDYNAPMVPFRNLLHGRDFPSVTDYPSPVTDAVTAHYRFGPLRGNGDNTFLWDRFVTAGAADNGAPFIAEAGTPWLTLTSDPEEGELSLPRDAHFRLAPVDKNPTGIAAVNSDNNSDASWTDLLGRRHSDRPAAPGVYIHNGKKIIIK